MTQNEKSKIKAKVIKRVTRLFLILLPTLMLPLWRENIVSSFKTSTEFLTDPFYHGRRDLYGLTKSRRYENQPFFANIGSSISLCRAETTWSLLLWICVVPCSYRPVRYKFLTRS